MSPTKAFKDLNFCDNFLFTAAMEDESVCKEVLECILEFPIKKVVVHTEHNMVVSPEHHGIRMDVHADDQEGTVFAIEMQTTNKGDLPQRSRYYQSQIDLLDLEPGDSYKNLRRSFIIFICTFDPFREGLYRYSFEERCLEQDMALGDGTHKIFLNTRGQNPSAVSAGLVRFLSFVEHSELSMKHVITHEDDAVREDALIIRLHKKISEIKKNRRMEERYMSFQEMIQDERLEARLEGHTQAFALITAMLNDNRTPEELKRAAADQVFKEEMMKYYHIEL